MVEDMVLEEVVVVQLLVAEQEVAEVMALMD